MTHMKLMTSIRIDSINPAHTRITIFTGKVHPDNVTPLKRLTRGFSGQLVLDTSVATQFILGQPNLVQVTAAIRVSELGDLPKIQQRIWQDAEEE